MKIKITFTDIFKLFIPILICSLIIDPITLYFAAWLGSIQILFLVFSLTKRVYNKAIFWEHIFRSYYITYFIFFVFLNLTSIFYFIDNLGYYYFDYIKEKINLSQISKISYAQYLLLIGHTFYTLGLLLSINKFSQKKKWQIVSKNIPFLIIKSILLFAILRIATSSSESLQQIAEKCSTLITCMSSYLIALSIKNKKYIQYLFIGLSIYLSNMLGNIYLGMKEAIIFPFLILSLSIAQYYRRTFIFIFTPMLIVLLYILPTFTLSIRKNVWFGNSDAKTASSLALNQIKTQSDEVRVNNWNFLTLRLSEVNMFIKYIDHVPHVRDFYGLSILQQSLVAFLPKAIYPNKPSLEALSMERAYDAGIYPRGIPGSAKPLPSVDGYLMYGAIGIAIYFFFTGWFATYINAKCEYLFGGYSFGSVIIFTSLYKIFWKGNSFEFVISNIFWSTIFMLMIFYILRILSIIKRVN